MFRRHRYADFKQQTRRVAAMEHSVLAALHKEGFKVAEPYLLVDTDTITRPYLVTEWIDGSTELLWSARRGRGSHAPVPYASW